MNILAPPHQRILTKLGQDISLCRRRRRMTQASVAARAEISVSTFQRLEQGDEGVALGALLRVLAVFGLQARLSDLAAAAHDTTGLAVLHAALPANGTAAAPKKVRAKRAVAPHVGAIQ